MKKVKITILAMVAAFALIGATCNPNQQRVSFNSVYSAETAVNSAYSAYLDLVIAGKVPTNDVPKVSTAFNLFQKAAADATAFISTHPTNGVPLELNNAAVNVLATINVAKGGAK